MAEVAAIILAAGGSSRFGRAKQLIEFEGSTLLERAIRAAQDGKCEPVIVVMGSGAPELHEAINSKGVLGVKNADWERGIGSSIRSGLHQLLELSADSKAVILLVCDQPFVTGAIVNGLIQAWRDTGKAIVASSYSGTLGVPALFGSFCFNELLHLPDDSGAKPVIMKSPERVAAFPFPEGATDIDTPADYESLGTGRAIR